MIQLKKLTDKCWILNDQVSQKTVGMVSLKEDAKYYLTGNNDKGFDRMSLLIQEIFNDDIYETPEGGTVKSNSITQINGYPVQHENACELETKEINGILIETYKTKIGSRKTYAAGHFGLKFKSGLVLTLCPKVSTIQENGFIGPFRTELDAEFASKRTNIERE